VKAGIRTVSKRLVSDTFQKDYSDEEIDWRIPNKSANADDLERPEITEAITEARDEFIRVAI